MLLQGSCSWCLLNPTFRAHKCSELGRTRRASQVCSQSVSCSVGGEGRWQWNTREKGFWPHPRHKAHEPIKGSEKSAELTFTQPSPNLWPWALETLRNILKSSHGDIKGSYCYCISYSYYVNILKRNIGSGVIDNILLLPLLVTAALLYKAITALAPAQFTSLSSHPSHTSVLPGCLKCPPNAHVLIMAPSLPCSANLPTYTVGSYPFSKAQISSAGELSLNPPGAGHPSLLFPGILHRLHPLTGRVCFHSCLLCQAGNSHRTRIVAYSSLYSQDLAWFIEVSK